MNQQQWQERVIQIRRVSKVVKGGKKLSFRVLVVVGNQEGCVGVGMGKAADVMSAVTKAVVDAKKQLIHVALTSSHSIVHASSGRFSAAVVFLKPAASGSGVIAGGAVRSVMELAGIRNVLSKQLGCSNPLNNAKAALLALKNSHER
jgi:small subunit ribosomal protein S5|uniref:Small ribosomal subunit protein uS5c n=1 Tax=Cyanidiaceae sp. MX-AZ01 TaxID=1503164 RepID=A0A060A570_9RHOD|nr:ribosomal protein S5 [Cyanidiaceae sp. MX-AZ01]UNJ15408.1 ribosomal protein S5 [Cyanidioschyzonaceae sp. 1]